MPNQREAVPEGVKRRLRQEAGFGCCQCGHPFIQYHHIIPYSEEAHFRPEDMMVLCPNCHDLCGTGAITQAEQRRLKALPRNVVENTLLGKLYVTSRDLRVGLAGGVAINTPALVNIGGTEVLGARLSEDGRVLISSIIQDPNGGAVAQLINNEWSLAPSDVWDFEVHHRWAIVRSAPRQIAFRVDCRDDRVRLEGRWHHGGVPITFGAAQINIGTGVFYGYETHNCASFITIH